jgi:hypothetical protein
MVADFPRHFPQTVCSALQVMIIADDAGRLPHFRLQFLP